MIYVHSMGRATRYYPDQPALTLSDGSRVTFAQLHNRVRRLAAALTQAGFQPGERLALLLPNSPQYIELVYACGWLGIMPRPGNLWVIWGSAGRLTEESVEPTACGIKGPLLLL